MWKQSELTWADPISYASGLSKDIEYWALLYSGQQLHYTGERSFLALLPEKHIYGKSLNTFKYSLKNNLPEFENAWFGYIGYELGLYKNNLYSLELPSSQLPPLWMILYRIILEFNHKNQKVSAYVADNEAIPYIPKPEKANDIKPKISEIKSNMNRLEYEDSVRKILLAIKAGSVYQANLTRKFYGRITQPIDPVGLFNRLNKKNPACYSSLLRYKENYIISCSPERFLKISPNGTMNTRPIKGSAFRSKDKTTDKKEQFNLYKNKKDRAENLMIVDLARNDIGQASVIGSVVVDEMFSVSSHTNIHHLSSSISGQKRSDVSSLEAVELCFPPGSMTGAPKLAAIKLCEELEKYNRGVYSGSIGWFGGDSSADLSVVIRTILLNGINFEFQTGGGIVSESTPEIEFEETMIKIAALAEAMSIPLNLLRKL